MLRLNKRKLKSKEEIEDKIENILKKHNAKSFFEISLTEVKEPYRVRIGRGRPGPNTKYKKCVNTIFSLSWKRNKEILKKEWNVDIIFPQLTTDKSLSAKEDLFAYKYQVNYHLQSRWL